MHSTNSFMNVNVTAVEIGLVGGGGESGGGMGRRKYMRCLFI